jgi:hypothetical protein
MDNDSAGDVPRADWTQPDSFYQQMQAPDSRNWHRISADEFYQQSRAPDSRDWHHMSAEEFHKLGRRKYNNTTGYTPEALASMPPPHHPDKVADDNSSDGSEPGFTPPSSVEYKSPPSDKRTPEGAHPRYTMDKASHAFEINDQVSKIKLRPEHVSLHAAAFEEELNKCETALRSITSSLPNANSYQAELESRKAFLHNRYEMAKVGFFVPPELSGCAVVPPGIDSEAAMSSGEGSVSRGTATSSSNPPVVESKDGRPAQTLTSHPVQAESRTLQELMKADFYSLTKAEKARVLLPLLTKSYPTTGESPHSGAFQHPEDATSLENQVWSTQNPFFKAKVPIYQDHPRRKSSPKAFADALHEISKGTNRKFSALPRPIRQGGFNRSLNHVTTDSSADQIEMTLRGASPKLRTLDQKLNDLKNFNDDGNLSSSVPTDSIPNPTQDVRTQDCGESENNRDDRAEQPKDHAFRRPHVVNDEVLAARIARNFEYAKGLTSSLHNPDALDPAHSVADPELSKMLSKMSVREDRGRDGPEPDQDTPVWFEELLRDEDDEVYVRDPSSSPWQSRKQSGSDVHWGSQGHVQSFTLRGYPKSTAVPFSNSYGLSRDELEFVLAEVEAGRGVPAHLYEMFLEQPEIVFDQCKTPFIPESLNQLKKIIAKNLEPGSTTVKPLDLINKKVTKSLEPVSTKDDLTHQRVARHLKWNKESQPKAFMPLSSFDSIVRDSTKSSEGRSEHVYESFTVKSQSVLHRATVDDEASARSDSIADDISSVSAQEMTGFDHSDGSESGSFKNSFSPCDSCGSIDAFEDLNGNGCMSCGHYTERRVMPREQTSKAYRGQEAAPKIAAASFSRSLDQTWGQQSMPKTSANDSWGGARPFWDTPIQLVDCNGWSKPWAGSYDVACGDCGSQVQHDYNCVACHDCGLKWCASAPKPNTGNAGDGWAAMSRDAMNRDSVNRGDVWDANPIPDLDHLLANKAEEPLPTCEDRSKTSEPVQQDRKLTKKEKKQLKKTKQSKNKKKKQPKATISEDLCGDADQDDPYKPAAKVDTSTFDPWDAGGEDGSDAACGGEHCWGGNADINANQGTHGTGNDRVACSANHHAYECWVAGHCVRDSSVDAWGSGQSRKASPVPSERAFNTTPKPADSAPKKYTVTYWATVECGDQTIHIPIDDNNISGPEKTVLEGPAKKMWKWVQYKGLGGKVGLQDAFDLANDLHGDDEKEVTGSNLWSSPPPSLRRSPSPARTGQHEAWCGGCRAPGGWCVCED